MKYYVREVVQIKNVGLNFLLLLFLISGFALNGISQHTIARQWNEVLLDAIRVDLARPTVHARNLFHQSAAMYDAWAAYEEEADTYFLGKEVEGFSIPFEGLSQVADVDASREEAISYAAFRLIIHRFLSSPGVNEIYDKAYALMDSLGYDPDFTSTDYKSGSPAALGNYIAEQIIAYGRQDGSNEQVDYANRFYQPVNLPLVVDNPGNPDMLDPNRWQPLTLEVFIDQSGNELPGGTPEFLSPEWGNVLPFALTEDDLTIHQAEGLDYPVYHDPGSPPLINTPVDAGYLPEEYKWGFSLVSIWGSHLDPSDAVMWDISPASIGNIGLDQYPMTIEAYRDFYKEEGGDIGQGHDINPHTGQPYEAQMVPRGDYARVLAEFWADGPDSETPPGHWFTILNYVNDHPELVKKFRGTGETLDDLEWDVKSYLCLGGAMHDAAITAWGIKGWYDYVRPISVIRYLGDLGQSSDPGLPSYSPYGLPLKDGYIELVKLGDPLADSLGLNIGKVKLKTWRGPGYINDPERDLAGVDWILSENWWPYQRPTFVTPNFAGYVSGHSTYSRAAAEVLALFTGDEFFPGGMASFLAKKNEFLVFEEGPSVDVTLQWATYRDASDQTSLSRIWGGIHPPADDIPGRIAGSKVGKAAFAKAEGIFYPGTTSAENVIRLSENKLRILSNPVLSGQAIHFDLQQFSEKSLQVMLYDLQGQILVSKVVTGQSLMELATEAIPSGVYFLQVRGDGWVGTRKVVVQ